MAKSLRSKSERRLRAIKRVRYAAKELERLKKTLANRNNGEDVEMEDITKIATVVDPKTIKEAAQSKETDKGENVEKMEVCSNGRVYDKKTLRDQYGNYPVWLSRRKIGKHKKGRAKTKKGTARVQKRLTRRQKKAAKSAAAKSAEA